MPDYSMSESANACTCGCCGTHQPGFPHYQGPGSPEERSGVQPPQQVSYSELMARPSDLVNPQFYDDVSMFFLRGY